MAYRRLEEEAGIALIGGGGPDAVGADLLAQADAPVGVEELEGRAEGEVVLERHHRRHAGGTNDLEDRGGEAGELLDVRDVGVVPA